MSTPLRRDIERFESYLVHERRRAERTVATYGRDLRALEAYLVEQGWPADARQVSSAALRAFLASRFSECSPVTIGRKVSAIRSFFRFLKKRGEVRANPAAHLRLPKRPKKLPDFLTVDQAFRVVESPPEDAGRAEALRVRDRAILELLYGSGLRVSELCGLDRESVDRREARVHVLGKGSKERVVPLGTPTLSALDAYLDRRPALRDRHGAQHPKALFLGRYGTRLSARQVQNVVRRYGALGAARGDLHPHALRHSCATHLLDAGADLRVIQELLGHASLSATQRYTHVSVDRLMEVYDRAHPLAHGAAAPDDGAEEPPNR